MSGCARASKTSPPRFYTAKPYGSERQFNPLTELVNEGYNNLMLYSPDLGIGRQPYRQAFKNLGHSLQNIERDYRVYGWHRALTNELFPLTGLEGGQWLPNYQDHLIGSGMVSARMEEWYAKHDAPMPVVLSYLTMTASHVLNEVIEQPNPMSVDAMTDLVVFDNLGFLLFRNDHVQRAFSGRVTLTSWAWQPVYTLPTHAIENTGQSFVLRFPLPFVAPDWRGFYLYGVSHVLGLSHDLGNGRSISFGAGAGSDVVIESDSVTDTRSVSLGLRVGAFYDRDNSLLASMLYEHTRGTLATINVYPGLLHVWGASPGLWINIRERGGHRFGFTLPLGLGLGYGGGMVR